MVDSLYHPKFTITEFEKTKYRALVKLCRREFTDIISNVCRWPGLVLEYIIITDSAAVGRSVYSSARLTNSFNLHSVSV